MAKSPPSPQGYLRVNKSVEENKPIYEENQEVFIWTHVNNVYYINIVEIKNKLGYEKEK